MVTKLKSSGFERYGLRANSKILETVKEGLIPNGGEPLLTVREGLIPSLDLAS